jgi:hypothetical protein
VQGVGLGLQVGQAFAHGIQLRTADQRAHAHRLVARVAHGGFGQARANGLGGSVVQRFGHKHAADGGALLARLHRHFAHHFLGQQAQRRGLSAASPGSSKAELTLSASMLTRTERCTTAGCERMTAAVSAEPVNDTTSNGCSWSSKPAELPQMTDRRPAAKHQRRPRP